MNHSKIKQTIFNTIEGITGEEDFSELDPNEDIREALDIDSFDFLNLLTGIYEELDVEVPEADYGQLVSLNDMLCYIKDRL